MLTTGWDAAATALPGVQSAFASLRLGEVEPHSELVRNT